MQVREIMHADVPSVTPEDDIQTVLQVMREHDLSGVPVVNAAGRCVGIVTDADLVISEEERDLHLPHHLDLFGAVVWLEPFSHFEGRLRKAMATEVADMMTADPITVGPDDDVREAAKVIARSGHNRLPVVEHGVYRGVVTRLDVLQALTRD